jgi:hypothetical protein
MPEVAKTDAVFARITDTNDVDAWGVVRIWLIALTPNEFH